MSNCEVPQNSRVVKRVSFGVQEFFLFERVFVGKRLNKETVGLVVVYTRLDRTFQLSPSGVEYKKIQ